MYSMRIAGLIVLISAGSAFAGAIVEPVNAQGTFLALSSNDNCSFSTAAAGCTSSDFLPTLINVSTLDGSTIDILGLGTICYFGGSSCTSPVDLLGVFSSSSTLTPANYIASGLPDVITATYFGSTSNTVTQDFQILDTNVGTQVQVPVGANFLVVGVLDSFYADNTGSPSVEVTFSGASVPEPGSYAMVLAGLLGLAAFRRTPRIRK